MTRGAWLALVLAMACGGCGGGGGGADGGKLDGGGGGGNADLALPKGCRGTLAGALSATFGDCTISVTQEADEQLIEVIPQGLIGDFVTQFQIALFAKSKYAVKVYRNMDFSVGSIVQVTDRGNAARYRAENEGFMGFTGKVTLDLRATPVQPPGAMTWADKSAHGILDAELPHDPDTAGDPNAKVTLNVTF